MIKIKGKRKTDAGQAVLKGLYAVFAGAAEAHGIPVREANIQKWRCYSLGAGNLGTYEAKRLAMQRCKQLGWYAVDDNAAEAGMIWLWACHAFAPAIAMPIPIFAKMSVDEYRAMALVRERAG